MRFCPDFLIVRHVLLGVALLVVSFAARSGELEDGVAAYRAHDYGQALLLLHPLAESGNAAAQYTLGQMYRHGRGFVPSMPEALPLLQKAAEANYSPAQIALGEIYSSGQGVEQNLQTALEWFKKAAASGNAKGQLQLGVFYIRIDEGRDFAQAAEWLRKAAEQGEAEAQYFLARLYLEGHGVERDRAQAMLWFHRASVHGHAPAQRFLRLLKQAETPDRDLALRDLRRQLSAGTGQLESISSDPSYGFDPTNPIKSGTGYPSQWRYLNALRGPKGEVVFYERLGACCPFDSPAVTRGKAFLDQYRLQYEGLAQPRDLFFNMFEQAPVSAPQGFTFVQVQPAEE